MITKNIEENLTQLQGNSADQDNLDLEIKQENMHLTDCLKHKKSKRKKDIVRRNECDLTIIPYMMNIA